MPVCGSFSTTGYMNFLRTHELDSTVPLVSTYFWQVLLLGLVLALLVSCTAEKPKIRGAEKPNDRINVIKNDTRDRIKPINTQARIPEKALESRLLLLKYTISRFGDDSLLSVFAAQVHQESAWCKYMVSHAGAKGCAQFMDRTAEWAISDPNGLPCKTLDDFLDVPCALSALVWLNRFNYVRSPQKAVCDTLGFTLSRYNGGGTKADERAAQAAGFDPELWFDHVEKFNGRKRTAANFKENRGYPRKILGDLQFRYYNAGYGGVQICSHLGIIN
jgi:hypothetical protein